MSRPKWEIADVIALFGEKLRESGQVNAWQKKTLTDLGQCRTALLGGHVDACTDCGTLKISFNSCRNRNCPKCQSLEREAWILGREGDLLPVTYYHLVFTLPSQLNGLCLHNPRFMYDALFDSAWATLQRFAADPKWLGAKTGATMVLHTWGQNLSLHPHVHCIVPAGGLNAAQKWARARAAGGKFLYPVHAMWRVYRAIFLKKMCAALEAGTLVLPHEEKAFCDPSSYRKWKNALYTKPWVVYAKRPFGGPKQVIEYLGRYTHKTAISNHRLLEVSQAGVRFSYKDYRAEGKKKEMTLEGEEFLRRFTLHFPPKGFRRMRHYGILSNAQKGHALAAIRADLTPDQPAAPKPTRRELRAAALTKLLDGRPANWCHCCKTATMVRIGLVQPQARAPPNALPVWLPLEP
jgi:Putative transposase/Transposase zinc-binding domain